MPCRILLERLLFFALARFTVGVFFRILRVCRVAVRLLLFLCKEDLVCKSQFYRFLRDVYKRQLLHFQKDCIKDNY